MFLYTTNIINDLEASISEERLSTYLIATGTKEQALKLYLRNSKLSSAFYLPLQGLEVTLRNALHKNLSQKFNTTEWFDLNFLDNWEIATIQEAKRKVFKDHGQVDTPHVIAELSFGFWSSLLNKKYHQSLWIPVLGKAFPHAHMRRGDIYNQLYHIRLLRNRIAHHEPIFKRHLTADYQTIIGAIGWINPSKAQWIDHHNQVQAIISEVP